MPVRPRIDNAARVLIVADEPVAAAVALAMNHGVYEARAVSMLADAEALHAEWRPHLLIIDIDLRDGNAGHLIGAKQRSRRTPTIVLTERGDLKTRLWAFDEGADDIVTLPLSPEELVARSLALMRRSYGDDVALVPVIRVAGLEIDLLNRRVKAGTSVLHLTAMEQALLYLLASNPGKVLDRETILDSVWGSDYVAESNLVDRHIRNLRVKLKNSWRRPRFIGTVPGKGYRFVAGP